MITAIAIKFEVLFFLVTAIILSVMLCGKVKDKLIAPAAVSGVCTYISHLMTYL